MNQHNSLHNMLAAWGRSERRLPPRNEELKEAVFAKLQSAGHEPKTLSRETPWLSIGTGGLALATFLITILSNNGSSTYQSGPLTPKGQIQENELSAGAPMIAISLPDAEYRTSEPSWPPKDSSVTDTREFLKTNYAAAIRTRHVEELASRLKGIIRGFGGRVDSAGNSERSGSLIFVMPAANFEAFRTEAKSMMDPRFFTEQTYETNLLPQKQSIEARQLQIENTLSGLRASRASLVVIHDQTVASIQSQLNQIPYGPTEERATLTARLANENAAYARKRSALDANIRSAESSLADTRAQNQDLLDNVATVNGSISLQWISLWEIADLYVPYWPSMFLGITALALYIFHRWRQALSS